MRSFWVKSSRLFAILIASLTFFALAGCSATPQSILNPYSQAATETADLFMVVFWIAVVIFILVEGLLVYFVLRYQRRSQDEHPEQYHGNTRLEVTWTLIPAIILAVVFALTIRTMGTTGPTNPPGQGIPVKVVAHQWWWEIQYNDGQVLTASELRIPAGQVVNLTLNSEDVIHSFWVPNLMGKTDTMPGHNNVTWLLGNVLGTFDGQCAEFCGTQHAHMLFRTIVQSPEDFQSWLASQSQPAVEPAADSEAARGKAILNDPKYLCIGCHSPVPNSKGPNLTHFASRGCFAGCMFENNRENLVKWLTNSNAMKPGNLMAQTLAQLKPETPNNPLTPEEVNALVAYLESLR